MRSSKNLDDPGRVDGPIRKSRHDAAEHRAKLVVVPGTVARLVRIPGATGTEPEKRRHVDSCAAGARLVEAWPSGMAKGHEPL